MTNIVVIQEPIPNVIVTQSGPVVSITSPGPQGPAGSSSAAIAGTFEWDQVPALTVWTIPHNLGFRPNVTVEDSDGNDLEGDITHIDDNNLTITFSASVSGTAYLS